MSNNLSHNYRLEYTRYRHYFHRIWSISQKPQTKVSLALLLTIITIIIFAIFAIRPTLTTVASLIKEIDELEEVLSKLKAKSNALSTAQQQYFASESQIGLLYQAVPETYELQSLIKLIEATAAFHEVTLESVSYGNVIYQSDAAPDAGGKKTLAITLSSNDNYDKVKAFVNDLSNMQRLLIIKNLSLTSDDKTGSNPGNSIISFDISTDAVFMPKLFESEESEAGL